MRKLNLLFKKIVDNKGRLFWGGGGGLMGF